MRGLSYGLRRKLRTGFQVEQALNPTLILNEAHLVATFPTMILEQYPELRQLSPADKLALVTELWDDLASHPEDVPVDPGLIDELDRRMEEYRKDPTQATTWEAVKARLLGGRASVA